MASARFPDEVLERAIGAWRAEHVATSMVGPSEHALAAMRAVLEGHLAEQQDERIADLQESNAALRRTIDILKGLR